ncbi:apolipoprotein N-acyltransferase [Roseovarius sp. A21]|uniref:Apolipoprotein N-acyltransferase n=1 Tax=Roseovarius bejariae TaxID=2576383 RepID=A0A844D4A6_9RHOB|nr:apolipoprotein N-acyltransferase [Roseovarius bejariae]MRU16683.1 apolipoprotein N-acyltransferase [Roseovarius bejariae]
MPNAAPRPRDSALHLRPRWRLALLFALGAMAATGQAPLGLWWLSIPAFAACFAVLSARPTWRAAAWGGWAMGAGYFALSLSWIIEPFLVDIARHGWMAPFALFGMAGGLALFWALAAGVAHALRGRALGLAAALTLAEALRGTLFTGFPWAQPGHALIDTALLPLASLTGSLGLTFAVLAAATALAALLTGPRLPGALGLAAFAALFGIVPQLPPAPPIPQDAPTVRLIQPNAPQHQKWDPAHIQTFFDRQIAYTSEVGQGSNTRPDLIVWPETAIPVLLNNAQPTLDTIARAAQGAPVVLGLQRRDGLRLFNSLVALDPAGKVTALYDKHHLVPFGEYIPYGDYAQKLGITAFAAQRGNGYTAGPGAQVIDLGPLGRALPLICYEGVFPQDVRAAPARADVMLLVTNDAWFGRLSGPYQHLAQARLRSVEQGLPMIRVANTGVSAMIDARGRVTARIPLGQAAWRDAPLPPPMAPTPYARMGDWPILAALLAVLALSCLYNRRPRPGT